MKDKLISVVLTTVSFPVKFSTYVVIIHKTFLLGVLHNFAAFAADASALQALTTWTLCNYVNICFVSMVIKKTPLELLFNCHCCWTLQVSLICNMVYTSCLLHRKQTCFGNEPLHRNSFVAVVFVVQCPLSLMDLYTVCSYNVPWN